MIIKIKCPRTAVILTVAPSLCCPLAGDIVPPIVGLTAVVKVYLITGAGSSALEVQDTTNKTDNKSMSFFIAAKVIKTFIHKG